MRRTTITSRSSPWTRRSSTATKTRPRRSSASCFTSTRSPRRSWWACGATELSPRPRGSGDAVPLSKSLARVFHTRPAQRRLRLKSVRGLQSVGEILVILAVCRSAELLDRRQLVLGEVVFALDDIGFAQILAHLRIVGV